MVAGERDEVDRHALQHHFGAQEHRDEVAPREEPHQPDAEQGGGDREEVPECDGHLASPFRCEMATAPMVATSRSVPASSIASRCSEYSTNPRFATLRARQLPDAVQQHHFVAKFRTSDFAASTSGACFGLSSVEVRFHRFAGVD